MSKNYLSNIKKDAATVELGLPSHTPYISTALQTLPWKGPPLKPLNFS